MNILHTVESYHPSVGGMQEVVKRLSELIALRGNRVTVATKINSDRKRNSINNVYIEGFKISGNLVNGITAEPNEINRYINFVKKGKFDVITNFAAQQWATDLLIDKLNIFRGKKVFVPTGFSGLYLKEYQEYFRNMRKWMENYDANVFLSNNYRDINFARKFGFKNLHVIPNGASMDEFSIPKNASIRKQLNIPSDHFLIISVGSHTGLKGHKDLIKIFMKANINNTTLLIIGNNEGTGCFNDCQRNQLFSKFNPISFIHKKKLIISELSREATIQAYLDADLFILASNIECSPIVLFESMASRTPFLTTDVGNAKEIIKWSRGGLILPTIKDKNGYSHVDINKSVVMLEKVVNDKRKLLSLANSGYRNWKQKYTWETIAQKYINLYKNISREKPSKHI